MMPVAFIALTAIPLTPNGKVDRMALPTPDSILPNLNADFVAPETPTENLLAQVWCEVLNLSQIGRHEIFFELGGHSLHVIKVKNRLLQYHDIEVSVRSLFESRTIAELAPIIDALLAEKQTHIVL